MKTHLVLDIDNKTLELANLYAKDKGISLSELLEYYIQLIILNEKLYKNKSIDINSLFSLQQSDLKIKKTNWKKLDKHLNKIRHGLPVDYKFDREVANER